MPPLGNAGTVHAATDPHDLVADGQSQRLSAMGFGKEKRGVEEDGCALFDDVAMFLGSLELKK